MLDQVEVALDRERGVLPDRVERGHEDAESHPPILDPRSRSVITFRCQRRGWRGPLAARRHLRLQVASSGIGLGAESSRYSYNWAFTLPIMRPRHVMATLSRPR